MNGNETNGREFYTKRNNNKNKESCEWLEEGKYNPNNQILVVENLLTIRNHWNREVNYSEKPKELLYFK